MEHTFTFSESRYYSYIGYDYHGKLPRYEAKQMIAKAAADKEVFYFSSKKRWVLFTHREDYSYNGKHFYNTIKALEKDGWVAVEDYDGGYDVPEGVNYVQPRKALFGVLQRLER